MTLKLCGKKEKTISINFLMLKYFEWFGMGPDLCNLIIIDKAELKRI